jgi:hypothetical protein
MIISLNEYEYKVSQKGSKLLKEYLKNRYIVYKVEGGYCIDYLNQSFFFITNLNKIYDVAKQVVGKHGSKDFLFSHNIYGDSFPTVTKKLISDLGNELHIKLNDIDLFELNKIDYLIDKLSDKEEFKKKYFISLVALIGEKFIADHPGAKWKMEISKNDFYTWHPHLSFENYVNEDYVFELYQLVFFAKGGQEMILTKCYDNTIRIAIDARINKM